MRTSLILLTVGVVALALGDFAHAVIPTRVMVRAVSRDAKIIGTGVGGARVTIRDASTGEVLAEGLQQGATGDTAKIIIEPRKRHESVYDTAAAAGFEATLMLDRPTRVEVTAEGPLDYPQAMMKASKWLLLVPGQDVLGDGILLEIHGFIVTLISPTPDDTFKQGDELEVRATVRMT